MDWLTQGKIEMIIDLLFIIFGLGGIGLLGLIMLCIPFWILGMVGRIIVALFGGLWHKVFG